MRETYLYERIALCDLQFEIFDLNLEVVCVALLLVKSLKQRKFDLFHTATKLAGEDWGGSIRTFDFSRSSR